MGLNTQIFSQFPWIGGLNTSSDPSTVAPNELTRADNLVFGERGSRKKREGINNNWDDQAPGATPVIGLIDYWTGNTGRVQNRIAVNNAGEIYSYSSAGVRSSNLFGGTAWGSSVTNASFEMINNWLIIAVDGTNNIMKKYTGSGSVADLGGTPPEASICRLHQGRLFTNDKENVDRLHYSPVSDPETWGGAGDSGAIDIGTGDGDPVGITAIFPTFKGDLFVAKRTKLYRVSGSDPETWVVSLVSNGIGCVSHNSIVPADQDDIFFVSEKGVHTLASTDTYGDFESTFISAPIQEDFNDNWTASRRSYVKGVYYSPLNSVMFAVSNSDISGSTYNNCLYLYNIILKSWYRWTGVSCESIALFRDSDVVRPYLGRLDGKIAQTETGNNYDTTPRSFTATISIASPGVFTAVAHGLAAGDAIKLSTTGALPTGLRAGRVYYVGTAPTSDTFTLLTSLGDPVNTSGTQSGTHTVLLLSGVELFIRTGWLQLGQMPFVVKGFKKFSLIYGPSSNHSVIVTCSIDRHEGQDLTFNQVSGDLLGVDFVLGESKLGGGVVAPYTLPIDGYGRSIKVEIEQTGIDERVDIQGFQIEFDQAGLSQEVE